MLIVIALLIATAANAEPLPPQPQPKIGAICPTGWSASPTSGYCVPGPNNKCRMMPKLGAPGLERVIRPLRRDQLPKAVRTRKLGAGDRLRRVAPLKILSTYSAPRGVSSLLENLRSPGASGDEARALRRSESAPTSS
jgi:hypothetical protein